MSGLRLFAAMVLILAGILVLLAGVIGIFRIKYALNRLHSAAMVDSLGLFLITAGMIVISGFTVDSLKLILIVALFWVASPVCSHLLSALEVSTNEDLPNNCEIMNEEQYREFNRQEENK